MLLWPFNKYPGTDYETFNWEWILKTVKEYTAKVDDFIEDINDTWNTFRNWVTNEIANMHRDFAIYVNATEGALNTGAIADGAITRVKIDSTFLEEIENPFITPQMFGAVADGVTDDSQAIQDMFEYAEDNNIFTTFFPEGTYLVNNEIIIDGYPSIYGTTNSIIKAGSALTSVFKYVFTSTNRRQIIIDTIELDGGDIAAEGILMEKLSGSPYLRNCQFNKIYEHNFTGHGFKFVCAQDSALYASGFYNCIFDSGISLNKFGDTVTINGCSFGRLSDNEFIQYSTASTFSFDNNNVTGYCNFDVQLSAEFNNDIFELQVEPVKNFLTLTTAMENMVMKNCVFSNQHGIADPSKKLAVFNDNYLEFIGCTFTANDAPDCYLASNARTSRFYGCIVSTGINNADSVLANFANRLFDVCHGTYGTRAGFENMHTNNLTTYEGLTLNNYIGLKAVNTLPNPPEDNTLYIIRSERKLALSLTNGVIYQTDEMTLRT